MNDRRPIRFAPRLEAMEDRVALSHAAALAHAAAAAHLARTLPNPVVINMDPQSTGIRITRAAIDPWSHVVRIDGVVVFPAVTPPEWSTGPSTTSISVSVNQSVNRLYSIQADSGSGSIAYNDSGFLHTFRIYVMPASGQLMPGAARITLTTNAPYYYWPEITMPSADVIVRLRPGRV